MAGKNASLGGRQRALLPTRVPMKSCRCACASVHQMFFKAHEMYIACMYHVNSTIYIYIIVLLLESHCKCSEIKKT